MSAIQTLSTRKLFTGVDWLYDCSLMVEGETIVDIVPLQGAPEHEVLTPAFIDLQIYGAGGRLFSQYPNVESLELLQHACLLGGTHHFLPTVATNRPEVISSCIKAVRQYWENGGSGCLGLHVEGPWLNSSFRGAHLEAYMYRPTTSQVQALLDEGGDVIKMITLAPECCSSEIIGLLKSHQIKISAGHTGATYEEALTCFDQGVSLATHLFNAMPPFTHRSPGIVGAVLNHTSVMASIIPDGYHLAWPTIQIAQKLLQDRMFVITDAVTDTEEGPYQHFLKDDRYEAAGILSGSALTMLQACNNLIKYAKLEKGKALRLCSLNPAYAFGVETYLGRLAPGYKAAYLSLKEEADGFTF